MAKTGGTCRLGGTYSESKTCPKSKPKRSEGVAKGRIGGNPAERGEPDVGPSSETSREPFSMYVELDLLDYVDLCYPGDLTPYEL